jgi:HEAT repeat protein
MEAELLAAALDAVQGAAGGAERVADALLARPGHPAFAPLSDGLDRASPAARADAEAALARVAAALVERFAALTRHPAAAVRAQAVRVLARSKDPVAALALSQALSDPDEVVQQAALASVAAPVDPRTLAAAAELARRAPSWALRAQAVEAIGRAGLEEAHGEQALVLLVSVAEKDAVDFVREAAIRALGSFEAPAARAALERLSSRDAEPRLRLLARTLVERAR